MIKKILFFCLFLGFAFAFFGSPVFRTQSIANRIMTLMVNSSEGWDTSPVIELGSGNTVEISFDLLGAAPEYFTYKITHCNADWTPSNLVVSEYLDGLQNNYIEDYENSFNTKMDYVNYKLSVPNDKVRLKISGNYLLQVMDDSDLPVLNACFSVVEMQTKIGIQVTPVTDKGVNTHYQAVNFDIAYGNEIKSPIQDLKVYVRQNWRFDNEAALVKPLNIQNGKATYEHNPSLIFDAGNEYRAFEMTSALYYGLGIEAIEYHAPYYHAVLKPDAVRSNHFYSYNQDINGRVYIKNKDAEYSDTEADYEFVHFYVPCDNPFNEEVYILSKAFQNILDESSQMEYSERDKGYVKTAVLKEGYYNYLYVTKKSNADRGNTNLIEGNYYETENEYCVMVYFRPTGSRYDRLIGIKTIQYK
ncbi:MAG: DUF5103 domain-containing protein [Dysgonamonadaceae bacterium]|jgi:hypothetical protein|nr:DUF5103 domain-containing protein [Dysgonamonadaceae bacterium]